MKTERRGEANRRGTRQRLRRDDMRWLTPTNRESGVVTPLELRR